jgi:MFS family permease
MSMNALATDTQAHRSRWLLLFCVSYGFIMLVFLNYTAVLPLIQAEWRLSSAAAGAIFSAHQLGYIASGVLLTFLTDRYNARTIFLVSAFWSVVANMLFALFATDFTSAMVLRAAAGLGMGGTYMPGLRLIAERFPSEGRGRAVGFYTSAFVFGAASSTLLSGVVASFGGWRLAIVTTAVGTLVGAILSVAVLADLPTIAILPTPHRFTEHVLKNRPAVLMVVAYAGHMWEQYGMRGWMAAFLSASLLQRGVAAAEAIALAGILTAFIVAIGGLATSVAGAISDRFGRTATIGAIMLGSGCCSLLFGWLFGAPTGIIVAVALIYSALVVAESPVLSAGLSELVIPQYLGAAMGLQTLFGFLAASASPAVMGYVLDLSNPLRTGTQPTVWGWAFAALAAGPFVGMVTMIVLRWQPESFKMAAGRR